MAEHTTHYFNADLDVANRKRPLFTAMNCMIYLRRGNGYLKLRERTFSLMQGCCFFVPCGSSAAYWSSEGTDWEYVWLTFEGRLFDEVLRKIAFSLENPVCTLTEEQAALFEAVRARKYNTFSGEYYHTLGLVVQLLASLSASFPSEQMIAEDSSMRSVIAFIQSNLYRTDLTVEYLARITGVGRTTLYQRFMKEIGCSPSEYIQRRRLEEARHLLRTTKMSVMEVAASLGYNDPLYFSRVFHRATNCSPTQYRKFCRNMAEENKTANS